MKKLLILFFMALTVIACQQVFKSENAFVKVKETAFMLDGKPYTFAGANYWQGMNLGAPQSGDQSRLLRELDELQSMGVTNLRVLAASEADSAMRFAVLPALQTAPGVYNEDIFVGLDFLLAEMQKRNMKAVMVLGNFWTWSGGFPQYLKWAGAGEIPYPQEEGTSWSDFTNYSKMFYTNDSAQQMMENHIKTVISRKNTITGTLYKNDVTIMSWQLANEPRAYDNLIPFKMWIDKTAEFIKSLDTNHLVCIGTEGNASGMDAGLNVFSDNDNQAIDYITMHIWMQNWGWFKPGDGDSIYAKAIEKVDNYWNDHTLAATQLNKPIVLEEFGIARDGSSFSPDTSTVSRDLFFSYLSNKVVHSIRNNGAVKGFNFWSYSGEGRPIRPGEFWRLGDALLGDPSHELQGWYGVYNTDSSTINIIQKVSSQL